MGEAIAVIALLIVLFVAAGVFVTVKAVRALQRGVERTGTQVRRSVEDTTLRAKSYQPGPVGEVARTRLELRSSIDNTRRALEAGVASDPSLREALGLLDRLHDHARHLDRELGTLMDREPDKARIAQRLPEAREQVAGIKESADSLRHAAQDRSRQYDQEGLESLRRQIEIESGALRHWESVRDSGSGAGASEPQSSGASGVSGSSGASGVDRAAAEQAAAQGSGAEPGERAEERPKLEKPQEQQSPWGSQQADPRAGFSRLDKGRPQSAP
ncbi:hypothetical protein [Streptomyces sp. ODS28]|uniref:hypothetical protein n=1 Tax=Streptomyces sp. ODS28 TaxID=3136688 RepID=UPI0031F0AFEE